jgi:type IV pilus modification protein PilV
VAICRPTEPRRSGREGFTLAEVLVAVVILAVGLLALEALGIGAARMVARADRESQYTALATDRMERVLVLIRQGQAQNVAEGEVDEDDGSTVLTDVTPAAAGTRTMYTVTVTVTPPPNQSFTLRPITVVGREIR